jgi:hypothetical protein
VIEVPPHAERHGDRAGDPLDGLVNMFDLGIVLALAFLLAALQSANLTELLTKRDRITVLSKQQNGQTIVVKKSEELRTLKLSGKTTDGTTGGEVGRVFRLADGRLVYVAKKRP